MLSKLTIWPLVLLITLSLNTNATSEDALNSKFKTAYYSYQEALESNDENAQFKYAKEAYELGNKLYGETDLNTANLALILAQQHLYKYQREQANLLLLKTLNIFKNQYGNNASELSEIYILLAQSQQGNEQKTSINYYQKALEIAETYEEESPYFTAQIQLEAGIGLLRLGSKESKVILTAHQFFNANLPSNDKRVVDSNFFAGKYYLARQKFNKAIDLFRANLPVFESIDGATHPLELNTHAFLIEALEAIGQSNEATKHCIAIGSMKPWNDSQEQKPLFRVNPKYPIDYARQRKSGWVKIGFTISDSGTVTDTKIIESQGGSKFEKSSLAAIKKWRYAPKFENGKPTKSYSTVQLDFKLNE